MECRYGKAFLNVRSQKPRSAKALSKMQRSCTEATVNRLVAGSNPARGANDLFFYVQIGFLPSSYFSLLHEKSVKLALGRSQVVRGYPEVSACPLKLTSDGFRLARELHLRG